MAKCGGKAGWYGLGFGFLLNIKCHYDSGMLPEHAFSPDMLGLLFSSLLLGLVFAAVFTIFRQSMDNGQPDGGEPEGRGREDMPGNDRDGPGV